MNSTTFPSSGLFGLPALGSADVSAPAVERDKDEAWFSALAFAGTLSVRADTARHADADAWANAMVAHLVQSLDGR